MKFVAENHVPADFVSTHAYADDTVDDLFGTNENILMDERVCRAVGKVRNQIKSSALPALPLFLTEWNVEGEHESRDTTFVGPALANTIRQCDGLADIMSFWTFSDVFEEQGPFPKPFTGMFGLRAEGGINKPGYYAYGLLHQLGPVRIANSATNLIATETKQGGLAIAAWDLVDPGQTGPGATVDLVLRHVAADARMTIQRVDSEHGNVLRNFVAMGSPLSPIPNQAEELNRESALPPPEETHLQNGRLRIHLTANALALVTVDP